MKNKFAIYNMNCNIKIFRGLELYYIAFFCNCLTFSLFPYFRYATTFYLLGFIIWIFP